jgi:putative FmdB family regulatory protein
MPTYEYRCPNGHQFDLFQKMSEAPGAQCPECGAESERLLSGGAGFLFKGNGFYITDYRSDSYKKEASKDAAPAAAAKPSPPSKSSGDATSKGS